jgi:hypothetical protein
MTTPDPGVVSDPQVQHNLDDLRQKFPLATANIANDSITSAKIAADAVGSSEIAAGAVGSSEIADDSIVNADVNSAAAILGSKLDTLDGRLGLTGGVISSSSNLTLTTSHADISGATVTLTPDVAAYMWVIGTWQFTINTDSTSLSTCFGRLLLDGADQGGPAVQVDNGNAVNVGLIATGVTLYRLSLSVASHTIKMQARKNSTDTCTANAGGCQFMYLLTAQ